MQEAASRRVLVAFETVWDRRQLDLALAGTGDRVELVVPEPADADCRADFDALAFVERAVAGELGRIDAVLTSSDYPGAAVAAAIASRLGLPGPSPASVLRAAHKWYSRQLQREVVPEATPR